ncbi:SPW repeat-containing protein [Haladaptatus litoreus]|uniref:SPW repeat-containing protein n=1 Tax=Haladaptatus litoreus TaxID=553468 RepID=A0A1N7DYA9_9EURY|nr:MULTISPECIES: SPW repeat protein [Haladaptatus]SIR80839.1 SPW repeat-containing protein [Haladaptatus litoreus]
MSETETRERTTRTTDTDTSNLKWLSGFVSLVGAWIFISSFIYPAMSITSYWNNIIIGAAIFLVAGYNYYRMTKGLTASIGSSSFVALLGLWMILVPFVMTVGAAFWSDIISGAIVAVIAGYNAYAGREARAGAPAGTA